MTARAAISAIRRLGRRLFRRQDGTASVEFVIVFPVLFYVLICTVESGYMLTRSVMLERSVDIVVRSLRLGQLPGIQHDQLKALICSQAELANTNLIQHCETVLKVELRPVNTATYEPLNTSPSCVDIKNNIDPPTAYNVGAKNDLMLVRACAVVGPIFPLTGVGFYLPKDAAGGYQLVAMSAFVNEPK